MSAETIIAEDVPRTSVYRGLTLYKVLDASGASCRGGTLQWSLPVNEADGSVTPGAWHIVDYPLDKFNGLHLTIRPLKWRRDDSDRVFLVEAAGIIVPRRQRGSVGGFTPEQLPSNEDPLIVSTARLLREVSWDEVPVFLGDSQ